MNEPEGFRKYTDLIGKAEFIALFSGEQSLNDWFTESERRMFHFPRNAGSLAARYLIKRRIGEVLGLGDCMLQMEILNRPTGKPVIRFDRNFTARLEQSGVKDIIFSLSHSRNFVSTLVIFSF